MGIQSLNIRNIDSICKDSEEYLKGKAEEDFMEKYFLKDSCSKDGEGYLMYHYMILNSLGEKGCTIVDYINKKLSGELDFEYRKRRVLQNLQRIEFTWECNDLYDSKDADCCEWKSIEW